MPDARKMTDNDRLRELRLENDLLRGTLALQFDELRPSIAAAEKGYAMAMLAWQNRGALKSLLGIFSSFRKAPAGSEPTTPSDIPRPRRQAEQPLPHS